MESMGYKALTLAQAFAPTGKEQQGFATAYNEMVRDGLSDKEIAAQILRLTVDGLTSGNWPR